VAHGARLVCLDNLYGYGIVDGRRTEATPLAATGPKGRVRVAWDQRLRQARDTDGLRFVVGRAGDFFGPGAAQQSLISSDALAGLAAGRRMWLIGDPDARHAFSYVPDVVRGLAALGAAEPDVEGRVFHLPVVEVSPRGLVTAFAAALGAKPRFSTLPAWLVSALGAVVPLFADLRETLYQWDRPFLADDAAFRVRFPGLATPLSTAAADLAAALRASDAAAAVPEAP
jgi:nucleoside-diphosphate-sugar epimerase